MQFRFYVHICLILASFKLASARLLLSANQLIDQPYNLSQCGMARRLVRTAIGPNLAYVLLLMHFTLSLNIFIPKDSIF